MPTIDDLFHSTLSTLGYDGAVPDQLLEYFGSLGYTGTLDDRWRQFFVAAGFTNLVEYLRDKGYEGSVQDMTHAALVAGDFFSSGPAFLAVSYDEDTYEAALQVTGSGTPTSTHTSTIYQKDYSGVYHAFAANEPVIRDGRENGGTWYLDGNDDGVITGYYWFQPAATNVLTYSNDFTNWSEGGTGVVSQDEVGLTGVPNSAATLTDDNASAYENAEESITITADTDNHVARIWVKKDAVSSRYPGLAFSLGGSPQGYIILDTTDGSHNVVSPTAQHVAAEVVDDGDWWVVYIEVTNNSSTSLGVIIWPAISENGTSLSVAATGSCIVGQAEIHKDTSTSQIKGLGPIFTTTAAASTDKTVYYWDTANDNQDTAVWYIEFMPAWDLQTGFTADCMLRNTDSYLGLTQLTPTASYAFSSNDGSVNAYTPASQWPTVFGDNALGIVYASGDNKRSMNLNGTYGTEAAHSGDLFGNTTDIHVGSVGANNYTCFGIRNLRRYDITNYTTGKEILDGLMT